MKKEKKIVSKILYMFICVFFCLVICGGVLACSNAQFPQTINTQTVDSATMQQEIKPPIPEPSKNQWGISLKVENVTSCGLTLILTQSGIELKEELLTGATYDKLQVYVDEQWIDVVGEEVSSMLIGIPINNNEIRKCDIDWEWRYGVLSPGYYRIGKEISGYKIGKDEYDKEMIYVQFIIN